MTRTRKRVAVLALQGAFAEHVASLRALGAEAFPVRLPADLDDVDGLVIPGGESTTIRRLMLSYGLAGKLRELHQQGMPILGTCAGMILLARRVLDSTESTIGAIDITVTRNAFGRQLESFQTLLTIPILGEAPFPAVFIRAPLVAEAGPGVETLATLPDTSTVAAKQGSILVTAFHPELTSDLRLHAHFLSMIDQEGRAR